MANTMADEISPHMNIGNVPYAVLMEIHSLLDAGGPQNNWRTLIAAIPDNPYKDVSNIESFAMESLRPGGSPTSSLLQDLANRGRTVGQLISYLETMKHEKALRLLKREEPVTITRQPTSTSVMANDTLVLKCEARGFPYPRYQWFKTVIEEVNGKARYCTVLIDSGTDKILKIPNVTEDQNGKYICRVHNRISYQMSGWVDVNVISKHDQPKIEVQPRSQTVEEGSPIKLVCAASGSPAPTYQWYRNEQHIENETSPKLYWEKALLADEAIYCCKISNKNGEVWTQPVEVSVIPKGPPQIMRQPTSVDCDVGGKVIFKCEVRGKEPLYIQWLKDGKELNGANNRILCINECHHGDRGEYVCQIKNINGEVVSWPATLTFRDNFHPAVHEYATDKVALVIANQEFRSEGPLHAPAKDAYTLKAILSEKCDFKVVALIDLTLEEMKTAVDAFCMLLGCGVYGLFYFAGHGFDHNGQSYLVPVDAPSAYGPDQCLCAQYILERMQAQNTGLNVILLDICRNHYKNSYVRGTAVQTYEPPVRGNTVFGYASSFTTGAFEVNGAENGIFMKYLKKHVANDEKVTVMLDRVIADLSDDLDARGRQFPEIRSNLREYRTLLDPINFTGRTQEFSKRQENWAAVNRLPMESPIYVKTCLKLATEQITIIVKISFFAECSNVLCIDIQVEDPGPTSRCTAKIQDFPPELDVNIKYMNKQHRNTVCEPRHAHQAHQSENDVLRSRVKNIQKLHGPLNLSIVLDVTYKGNVFKAKHRLDLPEPLIARSEIFKRRPVEHSYP